MPKPKPTLGYPSRTEAVVALSRQGLTNREIARRIGDAEGIDFSEATVGALKCKGGVRSGRRAPRNADRTVLFPAELLDALGPHAERRRCSANELARRIVEAVVDDELVAAVLDDENF